MRAAHKTFGAVVGVLVVLLAVGAPALACAPLVQLRVTPTIGSPGEVVTLDGSGTPWSASSRRSPGGGTGWRPPTAGVFAAFGAPFFGSASNLPLAAPIVRITAATG